MLTTKIRLIFILLVCGLGLTAQVVTTDPNPVQTNSKNITIYFHLDEGNGGMKDLSPGTSVYAHTGVITDKSTSEKDWRYTVADWKENLPKCKLSYLGPKLYSLVINDINEFYGVPNDETVKKLAFVFRTADGSKEGKDVGGSDIFVDVLAPGLQISLTTNPSDEIITPEKSTVSLTAAATVEATITISVNGKQIAQKSGVKTLETTYTFTEAGDYEVVAMAEAPNEPSVSTSKTFCYLQSSANQDYPGGVPIMGTVKNDDGSITFCLAAPQKSNAVIVGAWNDYAVLNSQVMKRQTYNGNNYFWVTVSGLDNETAYPYYFIIDNSTKIGDPYARLALDKYDEYLNYSYPNLPSYPSSNISDVYPLSVYQGNINDYQWKVNDFKGVEPENLIIYELLFRDFTGEEGTARDDGNVRKAIEKFDYLKTLGINAIELMPIMEFDGADSWGYNTNLYFAPDKAYGTPSDYKEFIDLCHQNGIAVILDIVFNQAQDHPWVAMYGGTTNNPFFNANAPHNYSVLNDWNQENPIVEQQWKDCLQYWLKEYKVDGFRFDLVKGLGNNNSYGSGTDGYNASRVARMKKLHNFIKEINPNAYHINENLAESREENEMAEDGQLNWANINNAGCQFAMGYSSESNLNVMEAVNNSRYWGSTVSYLESHDEQRLAYKQDMWGVTGVKGNKDASMKRLGSAAAQMILTPGAHMIWMFSEMGNGENTKKNDGGNITDCKIVNWSLLNDADHNGLYDNYCELITIRTKNPDLFTKDAQFSIQCGENNWNSGRTLYSKAGDKELITVINPNVTGSLIVPVTFSKNINSAYQIASKSYNSEPSFDASAGTVTVPANCYVSIATTNVTEVIDIPDSNEMMLKVYGIAGGIVLENVSNIVEIYTLDGKTVTRTSNSGIIPVAKGVYIVKSGSDSIKVVSK